MIFRVHYNSEWSGDIFADYDVRLLNWFRLGRFTIWSAKCVVSYPDR